MALSTGYSERVQPLLLRDEPLWRHTSLRVGGPARFFAEPKSPDDLRALLQWATQSGHRSVVLGAGTNVVFPDSGYSGLVIRTAKLVGRLVEGSCLRVAAGERLAGIAWWATRQGLAGLEWACGIPGSIGGAVAMNAGTRDGDVAGVLSTASVLIDGEVRTVEAEALHLGYRTSALLEGELSGIVVDATFALRSDQPEACIDRARSLMTERLRALPLGASAGSVFRNPSDGPAAGELLERAGCKGMRVGRAVVSDRHANVIVNEGTDNAGDVLRLIEDMKRCVLERFGVELREEIVVCS